MTCDQLLAALGLADAALPLITLIDVGEQALYACDDDDACVSLDTLVTFITAYRQGTLLPRALLNMNTLLRPACVGGIPMNMIEEALTMKTTSTCPAAHSRNGGDECAA
jgi:hypothetical protein